MTPDSPIDPRSASESNLTALLLGELPHEQAAALHQQLAQNAELAGEYERLKITIGLVRETVAAPPTRVAPEPAAPLKLSADRRQKLLQQFKTVAPRQFRIRRVLVPAAIAAGLLILAGAVLLPRVDNMNRSGGERGESLHSFGYGWSLGSKEKAAAPPAPVRLAWDNGIAKAVPSRSQPFPAASAQPPNASPPPPRPTRTPIVLPVTDSENGRGTADKDQLLAASRSSGLEDQSGTTFGASPSRAFGETPPAPSGKRESNDIFGLPPNPTGHAADTRFVENEGKLQALSEPAPPVEVAGRPVTGSAPQPGGIPGSGGPAALPVTGVTPLPNPYPKGVNAISAGPPAGSSAAQTPPPEPETAVNEAVRGQAQILINRDQINLQSGTPPPEASEPTPVPSGPHILLGPPETLTRSGTAQNQTQGAVAMAGGGNAFYYLNSTRPETAAQAPAATFSAGAASSSSWVRNFQVAGEGEALGTATPPASAPQLAQGETATELLRENGSAADTAFRDRFYRAGEPAPDSTRSAARVDNRDQWDLGLTNAFAGSTLAFNDGNGVEEKKRQLAEANKDLDKALRDRQILDMQIASEGIVSALPKTTTVEIVDKADAQKAERASVGDRLRMAFGGRGKASAQAEPAQSNKPVFNAAIENGSQPANTAGKPLEQQVAQLEQKLAKAKEDLEQPHEPAASPTTEKQDAAAAKPASPPPIPQPEVQTADNAFSTFSLNVSDVSFKLAEASLDKNVMPEPGSVRSEEFINAFDYRDPEPPPGVPVAFAWERAQYPFAQNRDLLRFSIKTAAQGRTPGRPMNIVLLLDTSGSMERADRVQIIREALRVLAGQLQPQDKFSVVTFARTARLWVDGVPGNEAARIVAEVSDLTPQGGTNLEDALNLAYATALRHYLAGGINRVVLLTDGAANLGDVDPSALKQKVETNRKQGIALDCFGVGWEGYNDDLLEVLSRNGDGRYGFLNTPEEAATGFAAQLAGALHVAASDVKVQVEFNPSRVTAYRQIGYARHQLTKEQFRDNTVNAAQIGAAESGNALYVIAVNPAGDGPLATVRVRYRVPGTSEVHEHEWTVPYTGKALPLDQSSPALRLAATAGAFSEWLASSPYAAEVTPDRLLGYLSGVPDVYGADVRPKRLEWMIRQAKSLAGK